MSRTLVGRFTAIVIAGLACAGLGLGAWFAVLDRAHYNGPRYVLWKYGVLPFDPEVAYPAMVGDTQREQLVVGLTVEGLKRRFGRLRTRADATAEYQKYYSDHLFKDQQVVWLGDSAWLVVLSDGRAESLHLMKG